MFADTLSKKCEVNGMARKKTDQHDQQFNRMFERQQRRLNRKWLTHAVGGLILLIVILIALQFTPYRNLPRDIFNTAKDTVKNLLSGPHVPKEPNPKYW